MVWQEKSRIIVMTTKEVERGKVRPSSSSHYLLPSLSLFPISTQSMWNDFEPPDILTGEPWISRRTFLTFRQTIEIKANTQCNARFIWSNKHFFVGHFAQFPLAGHFVRQDFTPFDTWNFCRTCPARPSDLTYSVHPSTLFLPVCWHLKSALVSTNGCLDFEWQSGYFKRNLVFQLHSTQKRHKLN